jgi:superfamily II DNA or RNA helicase
MIRVEKYGKLFITLDADFEEKGFLDAVKNHFSDYVENYQFNPKFKSGYWSGKISMYNAYRNTLPYGLFIDLIRFKKDEYPMLEMKVEKDVMDMFKNPSVGEIKYDLKLPPRDYQQEMIEIALKYSKGIFRAATASGKSLVIAYIIKNLPVKHSLIIVPTISLVEQFKNDMIEYGIPKDDIGQVWEKAKEFDKPIVISTWQTLKDNHTALKLYDCVICDEVHQAKAHEIKKIMEKCTSAEYRYGLTGTLPSSKMDLWNVKAFIGPVWREYTANELAEKGYISKCNVVSINLKYQQEYDGEYNDIKDKIFRNKYRMMLLHYIVSAVDHNILLLVGKIEKEGQLLFDYFKGCNNLWLREIVFIHGGVDVEEREKWRKECEKRKNIILIATYGTFQMGINIPSLKYIVLTSPFKSKIRVLQSIGRSLRLHTDKSKGSVVFDIVDEIKYLLEFGVKRSRYYGSEGFNIIEHVLEEGDAIDGIVPDL